MSIEARGQFDFARSIIEVSGLNPKAAEDTLNVSLARAHYILNQQREGTPVMPYQGRHPAIVNIATQSILVGLRQQIF